MNWIETRAGLQMAQVITKYLPRITLCLEHLASASDDVRADSVIYKLLDTEKQSIKEKQLIKRKEAK